MVENRVSLSYEEVPRTKKRDSNDVLRLEDYLCSLIEPTTAMAKKKKKGKGPKSPKAPRVEKDSRGGARGDGRGDKGAKFDKRDKAPKFDKKDKGAKFDKGEKGAKGGFEKSDAPDDKKPIGRQKRKTSGMRLNKTVATAAERIVAAGGDLEAEKAAKKQRKGTKFFKKKPFKKKPPIPEKELRYYHVYKPYGMLSQFSKEGDHPTLADLELDFAKTIYPVGRLDRDSEGMLIMTNDRNLNTRVLEPTNRHEREYLVQIEGEPNRDALNKLTNGPEIKVGSKMHQCLPCKVKKIKAPTWLPDRNPPIRERANIPTCWLSITLTEGKNRQVRKMTASVGHPTLRLVRYRIEGVNIENMVSGEINEWDKADLYKSLNIELF